MSRQLEEIADALKTLAADVAAIRTLLEGKPRRDVLIRELAAAQGLGATWAAAQSVALMLGGVIPTPAGASPAAASLVGTRLSTRQILRILQAGAEQQAADKSRALCQWPRRRQDGGTTAE